jgi:hypothetical protein
MENSKFSQVHSLEEEIERRIEIHFGARFNSLYKVVTGIPNSSVSNQQQR